MNFRNIFNDTGTILRQTAGGKGDFRTGGAYLFSPQMELAISAAAATHRPLLVTGPAGCGKSELARNTARRLKWRYLERSVHSRMEVTALLWEVDHLQRLQDAQAQLLKPNLLSYVRPAVLWNALDALSAANPMLLVTASYSQPAEPDPAVVLLDEIDKADPDLPNNLLEVLGGMRFEVADSGLRVNCRSGVPLIVITSNDERDLPPAFVRRCICLALEQPDLLAVGELHFPQDGELVAAAHTYLSNITSVSSSSPSAAEFLDFVQACKELGVSADSPYWSALAEVCALKGRSVSAPPA